MRAIKFKMNVVAQVVSASLVLLVGTTASAAEITDKTQCVEFVAALEARDFPMIRAFATYVLNTMDDLDIKHTQAGEPGIMARLSDDGRKRMVPITSVNCRDHPKMTVYNSAAFVYIGIREMQIQFGNAK